MRDYNVYTFTSSKRGCKEETFTVHANDINRAAEIADSYTTNGHKDGERIEYMHIVDVFGVMHVWFREDNKLTRRMEIASSEMVN